MFGCTDNESLKRIYKLMEKENLSFKQAVDVITITQLQRLVNKSR